MLTFRLALVVLLSACVLSACDEDSPPVVDRDIPFDAEGVLEFMRPDSTRISAIAIEIAESDSAQQRGLMERRSLPERGGMLFPYDEAAPRQFWMRNTPLPLDIIFVDAEGVIINIAKRTTPFSDALIRSEAPAKAVVEVRAGYTDRHPIVPGETWVRWRRVEEHTD